MKRINITWQTFWRWTVISEAWYRFETNKNTWKIRKRFQYNCLCECWNKKVVIWEALKSWHSKSCWCLQKEKASITWKSFKWKEFPYKIKHIIWGRIWHLEILSNMWYWWKQKECLCKCDCWNIVPRNYWNMKKWSVVSCWCIKKAYDRWHINNRLYSIWQWIKSRCNYKWNIAYHRYWWRWIKLCEKRNKFEWFLEDMLDSFEEWLTIDRINNDWAYCKENCRWATKSEQAYNRHPKYTFTTKP